MGSFNNGGYMILIKSRKMAIGTVSRGRKKVAEGKWVPVKSESSSKTTITDAEVKKELMSLDKKNGESGYTMSIERKEHMDGVIITLIKQGKGNNWEDITTYKAYLSTGKNKNKLISKEQWSEYGIGGLVKTVVDAKKANVQTNVKAFKTLNESIGSMLKKTFKLTGGTPSDTGERDGYVRAFYKNPKGKRVVITMGKIKSGTPTYNAYIDGVGDVSFTPETFEADLNSALKQGLKKSIGYKHILIKSKNLDYWKKKLLAVLKGDVLEKSLKDILYPGIMLKSLEKDLLIKARGFAVGTIRTWSGKEYKKLSDGKWMRTYTGTGERGERQAIRNVMRAIQGASTIEELAEIVNKNMQRFKDESGKTLPIVKEFMTAARGTEKGKKPKKEKIKDDPVEEFYFGIEVGQEVELAVPHDDLFAGMRAIISKVYPLRKGQDRSDMMVQLYIGLGPSAQRRDIPVSALGGYPGDIGTEKSKETGEIKEIYNKSNKISGDTDTIYVGSEEIDGQWKMVEADSPTASHDETTFSKTKGFPTNPDGSTINDRDYGKDKAAQEIVNSVASNFDGRALSFDSPIVVTEDGVVVSGNNRTMSSKIAARKGTDKKYIVALEKRAKKFGFTSDDIGKFKNPRVIFEIKKEEDYSTEQFAKFNVKEIKAMNPVEFAVKMSKIMNIDTIKGVADKIQEFDTLGELYASKKATMEIFNTLESGGVISEFNRPQYITEDGITGAGKEFLETVMVGSVVDEKNIRALNNAKSVRKKLVRAISQLVQNKSMGGYSISDEMNQAIDVVMQIKASGDKFKSVDDFAKQSNMFEEKNDVAIELAKKLELKEKDFADFMQKMNSNLGEGASGQTDIFFGEVESKEDVLKRMLDLRKSIIIVRTR